MCLYLKVYDKEGKLFLDCMECESWGNRVRVAWGGWLWELDLTKMGGLVDQTRKRDRLLGLDQGEPGVLEIKGWLIEVLGLLGIDFSCIRSDKALVF